MAVTVGEIIEGARDHHPALDPQIHPAPVAIRWLDRYHKRLVSKVIEINADEISSFQIVSLPLADFAAGQAAQPAHQYLSGKAFFTNASLYYDRLELLDWEHRASRMPGPAYSWVDGVLRLHGVAADWTQYSSLEIRYIPMTADLAADTDTIILPDTAEDPMVSGLALFMLRRQPEQPYKTYLADLRGEWLDAERTFLREIAARKKFYYGQVREVW